MEVKKNDKVNIEKTKGTFFQLGLIIVLSLSLIAFEWSSGPRGPNEFNTDNWQTLTPDLIPITEWPDKQVDVIPPMPKFSDIIEILENDVEVETNIDIDDLFRMDEEIPLIMYVIDEVPEVNEDVPFIRVEEMPTFRGGDQNKFAHWVQSNVQYPQIPAENGVQGKVFVEFVVEADGSVSNVMVVRKVDPALDAEAVRVISNSPRWLAGKQQGIPVRVRFTIVVNFQLQ